MACSCALTIAAIYRSVSGSDLPHGLFKVYGVLYRAPGVCFDTIGMGNDANKCSLLFCFPLAESAHQSSNANSGAKVTEETSWLAGLVMNIVFLLGLFT